MSMPGLHGTGGRVTAVLGPTNTGKTHFAVERMLGHRTGVIGLPLRLLAREVFDRVVVRVGAARVALVTGEERIVPPAADYFVCTVEAMPLDRPFAFVAVDEIQLVTDPERGHVFTDRLMHARGTGETVFLGSDTAGALIGRLVPEAGVVTRPRFSTLSFTGDRKLSRLPKRCAIVAFSATDVYAIAELIRRQRGGAAVVLGALSPRTRNAQVALFEAGDVDYLVATDAIGMGLNLNVDHVAFAALRKFDGIMRRPLSPAEIGQIAGRAGRYMTDGTFGTTADAGAMAAETIDRVESHRFTRLPAAVWRNTRLDTTSVDRLLASLDAPPPERLRDVLTRTRGAEDHLVLQTLGTDREISGMITAPERVRLLWAVCQIPDFRKTMAEAHARLLGQIFRHLASPDGVLPTDWVANHVARLDRTDGDIDTLATRISHVRTWTYVAHRADWLANAGHWQERTRAIEDRLSDALHERLTQRFVDHRTAALLRRLRDKDGVRGVIDNDGDVVVEGHSVGRISGLRFIGARSTAPAGARALKSAAARVVGSEIRRRAQRLLGGPDESLLLADDGTIHWEGAAVARLARGRDSLHPGIVLLQVELDGEMRRRIETRLHEWVSRRIEHTLSPLSALRLGDGTPGVRGVAFQLYEALGTLPRERLNGLVTRLDRRERAHLRQLGVRFGERSVYVPAMLRADRSMLAGVLWRIANGCAPAASPAPLQSTEAHRDVPDGFYTAAGYIRLGRRVYRADAAERLAATVRKLSRGGAIAATDELLVAAGCEGEELAHVMRDLGFRRHGAPDSFTPRARRRNQPRKRPETSTGPAARADSPFAPLASVAIARRRTYS
jgi:ATP-dependent RNA helicase SUPV3L1/SUV3